MNPILDEPYICRCRMDKELKLHIECEVCRARREDHYKNDPCNCRPLYHCAACWRYLNRVTGNPNWNRVRWWTVGEWFQFVGMMGLLCIVLIMWLALFVGLPYFVLTTDC